MTHTAPSIADVVSSGCGGTLAGPDLTRQLLANIWMHLGATLVRTDLARRIGGFDAWRLDPREMGDLIAFLRLWSGWTGVGAEQHQYSSAEVFIIGDKT